MKLRLLNYQHLGPSILVLSKTHPHTKFIEIIGLISKELKCPPVIVCYYLATKYGMTKELVDIIEECFKINNYTGIDDLDEFYSLFNIKQP